MQTTPITQFDFDRKVTVTDGDPFTPIAVCDLAGFYLDGFIIDNATLPAARFDRSSMVGWQATMSILNDATFTGTNLARATFTRCDLHNAEFTGTNLTAATFISCDLRNTQPTARIVLYRGPSDRFTI